MTCKCRLDEQKLVFHRNMLVTIGDPDALHKLIKAFHSTWQVNGPVSLNEIQNIEYKGLLIGSLLPGLHEMKRTMGRVLNFDATS